MKKIICMFMGLFFVTSTFALSAGSYTRQIKYWGVGTSGNVTGMAFSLVTVEEPNSAIMIDGRLQDTIEKQKLLAAILASIKAMGGKVEIEIGANGQIVNLYDSN